MYRKNSFFVRHRLLAVDLIMYCVLGGFCTHTDIRIMRYIIRTLYTVARRGGDVRWTAGGVFIFMDVIF